LEEIMEMDCIWRLVLCGEMILMEKEKRLILVRRKI
jgi:hypothetical protein